MVIPIWNCFLKYISLNRNNFPQNSVRFFHKDISHFYLKMFLKNLILTAQIHATFGCFQKTKGEVSESSLPTVAIYDCSSSSHLLSPYLLITGHGQTIAQFQQLLLGQGINSKQEMILELIAKIICIKHHFKSSTRFMKLIATKF